MSPAAALNVLADPVVAQALRLSAEVAALTVVLHAVAGCALAWALARPGWRGRGALDMLITVPLVFPPMALGFLLLLLLGRHGWLGRVAVWWSGESLLFSRTAVVLASFVAGLPLVVKPIQSAIEALAGSLVEAARTLGKREWEIALFVLLPNVRGAIAVGLVLGLARSVGEVGITLMLGGNIVGRTNTVSLEIYNAVGAGDFDRALLLTGLLAAISVAVFAVLRRAGRLG